MGFNWSVDVHFATDDNCSYAGDIDKSNLYLKLFKLVFGSVTLFAQENEVMLKVSACVCNPHDLCYT